jgi:YD repeat-containing protein
MCRLLRPAGVEQDGESKSHDEFTDALGRLARVDEPDASGNLGAVSSPLQPTFYQYDALDNLVHITQGQARAPLGSRTGMRDTTPPTMCANITPAPAWTTPLAWTTRCGASWKPGAAAGPRLIPMVGA